jgi:NTP pyrophosphatase (non-canonical NTP hydrolase)
MNQDYETFVISRFKQMESTAASLMHSAAGISGEAGEILDTAKKIWVYNQRLTTVNKEGTIHADHLVEELGDMFFYATMLMVQLNVDLPTVLAANKAKLLKRYPEGYSDQAALARKDKG